ncbi:MAG: DNA polymerase III subunit beta [Spirochaetaceae bacterium]|jgi:DNA polymerase-3 subunit beta|nr:DNA polymerase III subunit beta [Spirochaetaceae bacterium]
MKFTCEKSIMIKEIAIANEIISSKNAISILSYIHLNAADGKLYIKSTDITLNFETNLPVTVLEEGETVVKGDTFMGILNTIPDGEFEFEKQENKIVIKTSAKKLKYNLRTNSSEQFPKFPEIENAVTFEVAVKDFKDMIRQTIFSVSDDETRYFMNGVFFEKSEGKFIMVGTDGRRLAYIEKNLNDSVADFAGIIIPEKILSVFLKHSGEEGNITVSFSSKLILIKFASYHLVSNLIEGQFPNYRKVIPENQPKSFTVKRKDVLDALKDIAILVENRNKKVLFTLTPGSLSVSTTEHEMGNSDEEIACRYEGEETVIAVNYKYIEEPFRMIEQEEVCFHFENTKKALTVKPVPESDFYHVIMPMQN